MKLRSLISLALSLMIVASVFGQQLTSTFDRRNLDETCLPCQDFYGYVNGGWLKQNPIPGTFGSWGVANLVAEANRDALKNILEAAAANTKAPAGSNEKKIGDLYASCMDTAAIEAAGTKALNPVFAEIKKAKDERTLQTTVAHLHKMGIGSMFSRFVAADAKNSSINIVQVGQGGLSLPDRDYYLKQDDKSKDTRAEFIKHVTNMFVLLGDTPAVAEAEANTIMAIETKLAQASMDRVDARNPIKTYNKKTTAELNELNTTFSWPQYFKDLGYPNIKEVVVRQPDFFKALDHELTATPLDDWQVYLRWRALTAAATALPAKFDNENFRFFGTYLQGTKEQQPRWRRCVNTVDNNLGEALGPEYVKVRYPATAKAKMKEMIDNLLAILKDDLSTADWMSAETRKQALDKLSLFTPYIGHTEKWQDYRTLTIDRSSYLGNLRRSAEFGFKDNLDKAGQPVDHSEWPFTPPTLNAGYLPTGNQIFFPAGILQPPFFDFNSEDAFNYGAIGAIIGHEIGHGFDHNGRRYDGKGNLRDWWTADDAKQYEERASCIEKEFSGFQALEGLNVNGKLVLGEAIGDLVGLRLAYRAWKKSLVGKPDPPTIDGFTAEQRFFLGFGRVWGTNARPETLRLQVQTDPHPPARFRANGTVMNMPEFAAAFGCKSGDAMVREPACKIW